MVNEAQGDRLAHYLLENDDKPWYIPTTIKRLLIENAGHKCVICGRPSDRLHIDHINPVANGGRAYLSNLQVLCWQCNLVKSCHGLDPRSYRLGYVIPIRLEDEKLINNKVLEKLEDERA